MATVVSKRSENNILNSRKPCGSMVVTIWDGLHMIEIWLENYVKALLLQIIYYNVYIYIYVYNYIDI